MFEREVPQSEFEIKKKKESPRLEISRADKDLLTMSVLRILARSAGFDLKEKGLGYREEGASMFIEEREEIKSFLDGERIDLKGELDDVFESVVEKDYRKAAKIVIEALGLSVDIVQDEEDVAPPMAA